MLMVPQVEQNWCRQVVTHAVLIFMFTLNNKSSPLVNANLILQDSYVYGQLLNFYLSLLLHNQSSSSSTYLV